MHNTEEIPLTELAQKCHEESERYRRGRPDDRGYCFELFRRAVVDGDQEAWTAVCEQYRRLVAKWVDGSRDQMDAWINWAFAKFWKAVDPETFGRFHEIGRIMSFLRKCAFSVRIDAHRRDKITPLLVSLEEVTIRTRDTTASRAMHTVLSQELFAYVEGRLQDGQERLVFYLSFKVGLMPREIAEECADSFADVAEVRRIKERVVWRLSNDPRLQAWWRD